MGTMEEEEEVSEEGEGVSQQVMKAPERLRMEWEVLSEMKSGDNGGSGAGGRGWMALQRLGSPRKKRNGSRRHNTRATYRRGGKRRAAIHHGEDSENEGVCWSSWSCRWFWDGKSSRVKLLCLEIHP